MIHTIILIDNVQGANEIYAKCIFIHRMALI